MKQLKLKRYFLFDNQVLGIKSLPTWLSEQLLHGAKSRARTRFIKLISQDIDDLSSTLKELQEKYAEKDKDGKMIYLDKDGKETIDKAQSKTIKMIPENDKKLSEEFLKYLESDFILDVSPERKEAIYGIRTILTETDSEFSGRMAVNYDEWCSAFENIQEETAQEEPKKEEVKEAA